MEEEWFVEVEAGQQLGPRPMLGLMEIWEQFYNPLILSQHLTYHHYVLELLKNRPASQHKPHMGGTPKGRQFLC